MAGIGPSLDRLTEKLNNLSALTGLIGQKGVLAEGGGSGGGFAFSSRFQHQVQQALGVKAGRSLLSSMGPDAPESAPKGPSWGDRFQSAFGGMQRLGGIADKAVKSDVLGGLSSVGGAMSDAGGTMMKSGNPHAMAAGVALKVVGAMAEMPAKIKEWGDHLHEQNRAFSQWSGSMAAVMALDDARRIQLEREQGDRRAATAKDLADARYRLDSALAPIEDAFAGLKNNVVGKLTNMLAGVTEGLQKLLEKLKLIDSTPEGDKRGVFSAQELDKRAEDIRNRRPRHMR